MKKKMFWLTGIALLVSVLIAGVVFAAVTNHIKILVNGQEIEFDIQPMIVEDRVMVPIRTIAEVLGANVAWDEETHSVTVIRKDKISKVVANIPEEGVILSAVERDGMYENFTLEIKGQKRFYDWKNVSNPTYAPKLLLKDINLDGLKELIIIMTTGYGTGVARTEAHIIDPETLFETYIDNPKAIILKNVKTEITGNEVRIAIDDQKIVIDKEKLKMKPQDIFSTIIFFESICKFQVVDDELTVTMGDPMLTVQINYILKDNMYQARKIEFKTNSN